MATANVTDGAPRNIVVLCDGTSNQVEGDLSNVLKLYRIADQSTLQRVFYDPGVGTIGNDNSWGRLRQKVVSVLSMASGAGLDDNILRAYGFLCENFRRGDRIFMFGFSRGAYTVRALAGLIHMVGLLRPDQINLSGFALNAYKHAAERDDLHVAWDFARVMRSQTVSIHFVGVWDTVASMIVPRPDRFYIPSLRQLPYTRVNPSVRAFRHAMAIDERRRMFRLNHWMDGQDFVQFPFARPLTSVKQDCRQLWFAGNHSDVGGGYPETVSGLSKLPLDWMIREAEADGLRIDRAMFQHLVHGQQLKDGRHDYVPPDPMGPLHDALKGGWWILEWFPKRLKWKETRRFSLLGLYLPRGERRAIPVGSQFAPSVAVREKADPKYRPQDQIR
ncbi:DUF2235 domain-containing protein [Sphingomonas sp. BK580]|uniref:DUF2235 domain-containing protein n=1 Tax=Sphingomonas sp. BK580 TaxID=2586972 RepID=UPI00161B32D6|nr:DUF2235 domain-containing protein [Sphingomonas sp. BK580]MBB3695854.1 uncharacterized protein (DUF2235 family) [Sphingomonas sp. BK580]